MLITSLENNKIKKYIKLKEKKYREAEKLFLVEGEHLVIEAINKNKLVDLLVLEDFNCNIDFPYTFITKNIMQKLSNLDTIPNLIGVVRINEEENIKGNRILILDDVRDPGNLGTIIRSAVAFNVSDIVLSLESVDLYNEKVIRATQGMIFKINVIRCDIKEKIKSLKNKNYLILGTSVTSGVDVSFINTNKFALVMGNEGHGVKKEILDLCDKNIYIEMNSECESLNVGVAASIIMYELNK